MKALECVVYTYILRDKILNRWKIIFKSFTNMNHTHIYNIQIALTAEQQRYFY